MASFPSVRECDPYNINDWEFWSSVAVSKAVLWTTNIVGKWESAGIIFLAIMSKTAEVWIHGLSP